MLLGSRRLEACLWIIWLFWYLTLKSRVFIGVTCGRQGKSLGKPPCLSEKLYKGGNCSFLLKYLAKVNTRIPAGTLPALAWKDEWLSEVKTLLLSTWANNLCRGDPTHLRRLLPSPWVLQTEHLLRALVRRGRDKGVKERPARRSQRHQDTNHRSRGHRISSSCLSVLWRIKKLKILGFLSFVS